MIPIKSCRDFIEPLTKVIITDHSLQVELSLTLHSVIFVKIKDTTLLLMSEKDYLHRKILEYLEMLYTNHVVLLSNIELDKVVE